MTADLAGSKAAAAPAWLTALFERDDAAGHPVSVTCALYGRVTSPAVAREFTAMTLRDWGLPRLVPDVQIVVSELVTNAVRHACAGVDAARAAIRLRLVNHRFHLACGVSDDSARAPAPAAGGDDAETGRGLHLVDALTSAWGWLLTGGGGKVVWALFDLGRTEADVG